ncbi:MAG: alpha-mannosidase [Ruminococcaceae bacterium]|nr:alpha-mannosidase [Oscillospiraceae bacterium]
MHTIKPGVLKDMHKQLRKYSILAKQDISVWEYTRGMFLGDSYEMEDFNGEIRSGERWYAAYDSAHFFKASVTVPEIMDGKEIRAKLQVGGESLVKLNGKYISGATTRDTIPDRTEVTLGVHKAGEILTFEIEATCDSMSFCDAAMDGAKYQECQLGDTYIFVADEDCEGYFVDIMVGFEALEFIKDEHIKAKVYAAIDDSLHIVDYDFDEPQVRKSIAEARKYYLSKIAAIDWSAQSKIILTGHSHIDVAWLWRIQESIRKSARTFMNVTSLMDVYPDMTFGQSQAVLYQMMKDHYPEIYEKIKEKVANNQWDICGNVWVEADTNLASGEALIRQVLYGTEFFKKEFGKVSKTYWLPDCFGFTWALPQIIKGCGMENFITSKLSYNDTNKFPYSMFMWQGNNGDRVNAHLLRPAYNCTYNIWELMTFDNECNNKSELNVSMGMYGYGDGGGGPTREMMERGKRLRNFPGLPKTEIGHVDEFFEHYHGIEDELPVWNGEMFYENHRGTFTSQAFVKKNNRKGEYLFTRGEMLSVFAEKLLGKEYPKEEIEKGWRILMTNQFHDILPGSSIHEVFEDCRRDYAVMNKIGEDIYNGALKALSGAVTADKNSITVWNLTNARSYEPVEVEGVPEGMYVATADGFSLPCAYINGKFVFIPEYIEPMSCKTYVLKEGECIYAPVDAGDNWLENTNLRIEIDESGAITSIYDKINSRESLDGRGNILTISLDKCIHETAWNLELNYYKKMWELKADSVKLVESNAVRAVIRATYKFNKSAITQDMILYSNGESVVFDTTVDWHESDKVLKAGFDVSVIDTDATYDIAHGAIKRPTHWNTSFDLTRFEVAAHKWADLSEGGYGCSIINDCKYGYDIHNSHMRITLMRAPTCPDRTGDHGINTFKYAFHPHQDDWRFDTVQQAITFNVPPVAVYNAEATEGTLGGEIRFVTWLENNLVVDAIKKAQDGRGYIIRVVEEEQKRGECMMKLNFAFDKVYECNMIEEDIAEIPVNDNGFSFSIKPFQVKTFRVI